MASHLLTNDFLLADPKRVTKKTPWGQNIQFNFLSKEGLLFAGGSLLGDPP